jgi:hypothetical protein
MTDLHDFNDDAYWIQAPPGAPDASTDADDPGAVRVDASGDCRIWVDCRINLRKVSKVDTVNGTAFVRIEIVRLSDILHSGVESWNQTYF